MRLALVFDKLREDTLGVYMERACESLGIEYEHFWTKNADAIPSGYDLYLRIDHGDYHEDVPDHLRPKVLYAVDTHLPKSWKRIKRLVGRYDLVCCVHRKAATLLPNAAWVPVACDPQLHHAASSSKRWDVACIGTEGGVPRKFYLQALRERYPRSVIRHAPHTQLGTIYGQARIGFNYSIRDDINMRMFEILSGGALLVTNRLSHGDLERLGLREREHLVCYRSPRELFVLIDYYLEHAQEREAIARNGMAQVLQHHTYRHRLQAILKLAEERCGVQLNYLHPSMTEGPLCISS